MKNPGAAGGPTPPRATVPAGLDRDGLLGRVLDALSMFAGILSPDGVLLAANRAPLEAAGLEPGDVLDRPFWDCYWWSHDPVVQERLKAAVARARSGERERYDAEVRVAGGRLLPIDFMLAPMCDADGRVAYLVASAVDLSERRAIQQRLRDSEERSRRQLAELEAIYRTAPVGLCVIDPELRFVRMNDRLAEINGLTVEDHLGRRLRDVVPGLADQAEPMLRRVLETGLPVNDLEIEGETPAQPGRRRTWRENWIPLIDESSGRVLGVNVVAQEITEWKSAVCRLRESEANARSLAQQRELLLQELNHRVKNSLALVASMLALQRRQCAGEAEAALADAHRRILAIARVHESLYGGIVGDRIDLAALAEKLILQASVLRPGVEGTVEARGPASLSSDRAVSFGLLLNELLVNALKHGYAGDGGGSVIVRMEPREPDAVLMTVADDGGGLPEGWSLEGSGGLGGRLIRGLADQLEAEVSAYSEPGRGARFEVLIPLKSPPPPAA
jgi:PAS domain S-box-containing protein